MHYRDRFDVIYNSAVRLVHRMLTQTSTATAHSYTYSNKHHDNEAQSIKLSSSNCIYRQHELTVSGTVQVHSWYECSRY